MEKSEFIAKFKELLEYDGELDCNTKLDDIEEWDSIALISTAAMLDKAGKKVSVEDLKNVSTVADIANLAGI